MSEEFIILVRIILIDLILSADNAIIIGMTASQFDESIRKKVLIIGTAIAVIARIVFALATNYLLQINGIKTIGGLLLVWVVYKLYVDVLKQHSSKEKEKRFASKDNEKAKFGKAVITILFADISLSLDNVIAVAGTAGDHVKLLVFGIVLAIVLMATLANFISKYIQKYLWIGWLGLLSIIWVAVDLIYQDIKFFFF